MLEWTDLHRQYVELVETKLDGFCQDNGANVEEMFKEISEASDNAGISEFLPQIILNTEYHHFSKQMKAMAEKDDDRRRSMAAAQVLPSKKDGIGFNLSGVYHKSPDDPMTNADWDRFLQAVKCPWVFRKLITKSAMNIKDVFITHNENQMIFKYKMKFFGTREMIYNLDGKSRDVENVWKVMYPQCAFNENDRERVVVKVDPHPSLGKGGYTEHNFHLKKKDGVTTLVWGQALVDPSQNLDFESEMWFQMNDDDDEGAGHK